MATILMNVGLLTTTASVYQMMRGAEMLFAAVLAVIFLHRHLNRYNYMGLACSTVSWAQRSFSETILDIGNKPWQRALEMRCQQWYLYPGSTGLTI